MLSGSSNVPTLKTKFMVSSLLHWGFVLCSGLCNSAWGQGEVTLQRAVSPASDPPHPPTKRKCDGTVWSPTVTVHALRLCCSAQTLPSLPFISSTSNSWRLLRRDRQFPSLSRTPALPDRCQFYIGRIRNASYCSAVWKWCQLSCRGLRREAVGKQLTIPAKTPTDHIIWGASSLFFSSVSCAAES